MNTGTKLKLSPILRFQEIQTGIERYRVPEYVTGTRVTATEAGTRVQFRELVAVYSVAFCYITFFALFQYYHFSCGSLLHFTT